VGSVHYIIQKDIQQLERVQRRPARFVKKDLSSYDFCHWSPRRTWFERRKHSRLTVFYKALNNLSAISWDHISVSSWHTRASSENKFMSLPVRTDVFKYSFFLGPLPIGIPFHRLFASRSRFSPSMGVC